MSTPLKAPFPYFGGKSRAASLIWERLGNTPNYVEPFAGSLAVLLGRPHAPKIETVNDKDCYLANFWRALKLDPEAVARYADWPVNEADLHARHKWLIAQADFRERMLSEPEYYDVKIAGWWAWGLSSWIGGGWCDGSLRRQLPHLIRPGQGIKQYRNAGTLLEVLTKLSERLQFVRVACGDWSRIVGQSVTFLCSAPCAVVLDPPYAGYEEVYNEASTISADVRAWAIENGDNPQLRIALCGYDGEHAMPDGWTVVEWRAAGGHGNRNDGYENKHRERIWFSPHCLKVARVVGHQEAMRIAA